MASTQALSDLNIAALRLKVNDNYDICIYKAGTYKSINWNKKIECSLGQDYSVYEYKEQNNKYGLSVEKGLNYDNILRLKETKKYTIRIEKTTDIYAEMIRFPNESNKRLRVERDEYILEFQFVNYLGRARVFFPNNNGERVLEFEVVPDKIDYETDYIELTKSIANHCAELLLEHTGPTSNVFKLAEENSKTLLEQFIFLRKFCFSENINGLFEMIKSNPDRILVEEEELRPIGLGRPSKKVYSNPFKYARNWYKFTSTEGREFYLPEQMSVARKYDNLDTPANRFVKFALEQFDIICEKLIKILGDKETDRQSECRNEAIVLHEMIGDILNDSFFDDVGQLTIMVQNNQVLQKREGYSQLFLAYSMLDLALQLDWEGKGDVYEGESKNIALLYEYWLFFELCKIVERIDGCIVVETKNNSFIKNDNGQLSICLQEGKESCKSFEVSTLGTKINLYYNRTFSPTNFSTTMYEGSYSRPFRPDYTLAIFPSFYENENAAIKDGAVSYVHFDAKYRVTDITAFINKLDASNEEYEQELAQEKNDEVTNTYKRGDLLKMHTYNDAIRRTVGSYVLYPGSGSKQKGAKNTYNLFDEILPGVGAFAIKPSNSDNGEEVIKDFITGLIVAKSQNSTRLNRLNYYSGMVMREPALSNSEPNNQSYIMNNKKKSKEDLCVIGYMRSGASNAYFDFLKENEHLKKNIKSELDKYFYFYYYAIKDGIVYSHHRDIDKATRLRIFTNNIDKTNTYDLEAFECEIIEKDLVSKAGLVKKLNDIGFETKVENHSADYYYVMKVQVVDENIVRIILDSEKLVSNYGNDSFSPHSPKVVPVSYLKSKQYQSIMEETALNL